MKMYKIFAIAFLASIFSSLAYAGRKGCSSLIQAERTYGAEWTFTNEQLIKAGLVEPGEIVTSENKNAQTNWIKSLKKRTDLKVEEIPIQGQNRSDFLITDREGWWFIISLDPGVIEIKTKPSTVAEYEAKRSFIEKEIFEHARNLGLAPNRSQGGGHIHIGIQSFKTYMHFRNFLVDLFNHDPIFTDIFRDGRAATATPLSHMPIGFRKKLKMVLEEVDILPGDNFKKIVLLCQRIQKEVYTDNLVFAVAMLAGVTKYQAYNLTRIVDQNFSFAEKTIELRSIAAQQSFEEFLLQIQLFEARIDSLADKTAVSSYEMLGGPLWDFQILEIFRTYVVEAGQSWAVYQKFLPERMQKDLNAIQGSRSIGK